MDLRPTWEEQQLRWEGPRVRPDSASQFLLSPHPQPLQLFRGQACRFLVKLLLKSFSKVYECFACEHVCVLHVYLSVCLCTTCVPECPWKPEESARSLKGGVKDGHVLP